MSYIKLYSDDYLLYERNSVIDDIESYLGTLTTSILEKYQYIRPLKNITIKIDKSQGFSEPFQSQGNSWNYLSLRLYGAADEVYYYFITHKLQKASGTIELTCVMDVLNTFKWNTDYTVNKKTLVMREHKDRVIDNEIDEDTYPRNIDLRSEGINAPLYKNRELKILQDNNDLSWILYYRNRNQYDSSDPDAFTLDNPVDCFIAPSSPVNARYSVTNLTINATSFTNDGYYYIDASKYQFKINGTTYSMIPKCHWEIHKASGVLEFKLCVIKQSATGIPPVYYYVYSPKSTIASGQSSFDVVNPSSDKVYYFYSATVKGTGPLNPIVSGFNQSFSISPTTIDFLLTPESINKSDSRNIKIIELPYAPLGISYDSVNDIYLFGPEWDYDVGQKLFKLKALNLNFGSSFKALTSSFWDGLVVDGINGALATDLRKDKFESKIYHSDFYRPKFVYDSFYVNFDFEKIDFDGWWSKCQELSTTTLYIDFIASRNVISKFMFKFPQYITKYGQMDFDNICCVARNNEQVIYNSTYLNYIRNGYNYDLKSRQRAEETGAVGLGVSAATTVLGVVAGIATQNYALAGLSAVTGGMSIASSSISYAKSVAQSEQNMNQKLQDAKNQAVSVGGADDIDLLNAYCDNKAKFCLYEVSSTMKKALLDMFYYSGYETIERKIPSINTRYWFNYLQCELSIDQATSNAYLSDELKEELKAKFKEGVTFFHHHSTWDLGQVMENYESWILS